MSMIRLPHLAAALVGGLVSVSVAHGMVGMKVLPVTVDSPASETDVFADVVLQLTDGTPAPSLKSFSVGFTMVSNGGAGATLVGAEYNGGPFPSTHASATKVGNTAVFANDSASANPVFVPEGSEMFRLRIHLDPGAVGIYTIYSDLPPLPTMIGSDNLPLNIILSPGYLTINPVPEPGSLGLLGIAGLGLIRRRSR